MISLFRTFFFWTLALAVAAIAVANRKSTLLSFDPFSADQPAIALQLPLFWIILSAALVGRYKKNVLLMSLLISLIAATLYYVTQMVTMLLAKNESVSPAAGAFAPIIIFSALVLALFKARPA